MIVEWCDECISELEEISELKGKQIMEKESKKRKSKKKIITHSSQPENCIIVDNIQAL